MGFLEEPRKGMLSSLLAFLKLCLKPAKRLLSRRNTSTREEMLNHSSTHNSPLNCPKRLLTKITRLNSRKGIRRGKEVEEEEDDGFGNGGLWQKDILMGEKCQPPVFSGVIYYDHNGKQLSEMPRSPRASPCPPSILLRSQSNN